MRNSSLGNGDSPIQRLFIFVEAPSVTLPSSPGVMDPRDLPFVAFVGAPGVGKKTIVQSAPVPPSLLPPLGGPPGTFRVPCRD